MRNIQSIKLKNGQYRMAMSFSKQEMTQAKLRFGTAGINYAMPRGDNEVKAMHSSFGWIGNNANIFLPDLNVPDGVIPKPEDFVQIPFRLLSATIVAGGTWRATDFSDESVLRASVNRLDKKPVYLEHDTTLENWVGLVQTPKWTNAFRAKDGTDVPAGIDGMISIDAKTNPKILRGVLAGGIFSNSVTVVFDWKPSHEFQNDYDFERMIGTLAEDGNMIRRVVTKIHDYYESSLVWLGADPYAKLIDEDGNLVHIDHVNAYNKSFEKETDAVKNTYTQNKSFEISCGLTKDVLYLSHEKVGTPTQIDNNKVNNSDMKPELVTLLLALFGLSSIEAVTEAHIKSLQVTPAPDAEKEAEVQANAAVATKAVSLMKAIDKDEASFDKFVEKHSFVKTEELAELKAAKESVATLTTEKENLTAQVADLTPKAEFGTQMLSAQRAEVERLYKASALDKASDAVISLIAKADIKELQALAIQYGGKAMLSFGGKCKSCGSDEISFQSSRAKDEEVKDAVKPMDFESIRDKYSKKSIHI